PRLGAALRPGALGAGDAGRVADPQARGLRGGDELRHLPALLLQRRALPGEPTPRLDAAAGPAQPAHLRRRPDAPDAAREPAPRARPGRIPCPPRHRRPGRLLDRLPGAGGEVLRPRTPPGDDESRRLPQTPHAADSSPPMAIVFDGHNDSLTREDHAR